MDTNLKDSEPFETMEPAINAENASFPLENGGLVTSQKPVAEVIANPGTPDSFKSPLDFSTVTVQQLGITSESFVKNSAGKSSSCLKKVRRRSSVGVRGSPETNNLIRFIAQQRNLKNAEKSPLTQDFHFPGSPVLYRNVNSLKERISAFQSAFNCKQEKEKITDCPEFSEAEGFLTTGLTRKEGLGECQQSPFLAQLSKRRRISSQSNSDGNLTNVVGPLMVNVATPPSTERTYAFQTSLVDLSEKLFESGITQSGCLVEESVPLPEFTEASAGIKVADRVEDKGSGAAVSLDKLTGSAPDVGPLVTPLCKRGTPSSETSALRSVLKKPPVKLCVESLQEHCNNLCDNGTRPNLISTLVNYCKEQKAEGQENYKVPASINMRKRKRVTFGEDLSPEVFDESLPANTPLRKGETPVRKKDLNTVNSLPLEQSPAPSKLPQPNFDDRGENLALHHLTSLQEERGENIEPLQVSFAVSSPLSKSSISENLSGTDTSANNHNKIPSYKGGRRTRTSNRRSQLISFAEDSVCNLLNTEAQPCQEKKIKRRKSQESKCTDRALKSCRKKKARRKKGVEKTLYGEREMASKKPLLSPIPELPEVYEMSSSVPCVRRKFSGDFNSHGEREERKPPGRKHCPPRHSDLNPEVNKHGVSESRSTHMKSSLSLTNSTVDHDSSLNAGEICTSEIIPKAETKLESESDLKTGVDNENSPASGASVTEKPIVSSDGPPSALLTPPQELSAADPSVENHSHVKVPGDTKCEQQDDCLGATEGELQTKHLLSGSPKERDRSADVLVDSRKGKKSKRQDVGKKSPARSGGGSCERKGRRRRSVSHPDGQSSHLETDGSHRPSHHGGSSVETSLENSELYKDLADSLEQTFQRTNRETKVRRSTRLQRDLENEGLVWMSLPLPSTACPPQRTKRRTMHAFDSRGLEGVSPRRKAVSRQPLYSTSDQENREGLAVNSSTFPQRRRKSFCTSALANTENAKSKC
ncbi:cell division cycle-associated protein 2 isoform X2 [Pipistrellus kuhlii]|uniref:cell division cycle-associated protein 2 isoform X2 n=1 Tax=Pipistrellus kuhlii TaxID=59472 RepID=UPI001E2727B6|nr:cell division cycle-associated protein 2 isoform X2 [Pipistrellus kuhlii]